MTRKVPPKAARSMRCGAPSWVMTPPRIEAVEAAAAASRTTRSSVTSGLEGSIPPSHIWPSAALAASLARAMTAAVVAAKSAPALMKTERSSQRSGSIPGAFGWVASPMTAPKKPPPNPRPPAIAAWRQTSTWASERAISTPSRPIGVA